MLKSGQKADLQIVRWEKSGSCAAVDSLAVEAPLQIDLGKINGTQNALTITMRTPGHDEELAVGFAFAEGILQKKEQLGAVLQQDAKSILLLLDASVQLEAAKLDRNFLSNSSCGVCGKSSLEFLKNQPAFSPANSNFVVKPGILSELPTKISQAQSLFAETGGNHAAVLFDAEGTLLVLREDVGRHNALDTLLGWAFQNNQLPLSKHMLLLSGRASFELIQKAGMAGIGMVAAVGAPSSLAVELAEEWGITLVGFLKKKGHNIYTHPVRLGLTL